jgi:SAM-dependent methyltransferase
VNDKVLGFAKELEVDFSNSPVRTLFTMPELDGYRLKLRSIFEDDRKESARIALAEMQRKNIKGFGDDCIWFQRIPVHGFNTTTTSNHSLYSGENPGPLNSLWGKLSPMEATILRPLPKWMYLEKVLPTVRNKTVLEIGSACGFWPLKFAEMGARFACGIEVDTGLAGQAKAIAKLNQANGRVHFVLGDAYFDPSIPVFDIVFMSEVLIHSITPEFSLLRALNLANEFLIIDDFFARDPATPARLHLMRDTKTGKITWTGYTWTEALFFQFLYMYGVEPERVLRYHDPLGEHTLMVIDTSGMRKFRSEMIGHSSLQSSVAALVGDRSYARSLAGATVGALLDPAEDVSHKTAGAA